MSAAEAVPDHPVRVFIGLGANLGDRLENMREALVMLRASNTCDGFVVSSVYETAPVDCPPGSPSFLNAAASFETRLAPLALLDLTQSIESSLGRASLNNREVNAPRPVDLDLLDYDGISIDHPRLILPHPRILEREFVLRPLSEIHPTAYPPETWLNLKQGVSRYDQALEI